MIGDCQIHNPSISVELTQIGIWVCESGGGGGMPQMPPPVSFADPDPGKHRSWIWIHSCSNNMVCKNELAILSSLTAQSCEYRFFKTCSGFVTLLWIRISIRITDGSLALSKLQRCESRHIPNPGCIWTHAKHLEVFFIKESNSNPKY